MRRFKNDIRYNLNLPENTDGEELLNIVKNNQTNPIVKEIIDEYIENLCIGISNIVDILEPQAICIGGGFSYYKEIFLEKFINEFYNADYVFYKENMPKIVIAELGNDAGIIGSALYA
jgi:glucokinase